MNNKKTIINRWVIIAIGSLLMAIIFYYFFYFSPAKNQAFFPSCSFKSVTGYDCVGCGGQRAVHELLHFNFMSAIDYNALFVLSIPLLIYYIYYAIRRFIYGIAAPNHFLYQPTFGLIYIGIILFFLISRNSSISFLEWLNSSLSF